MIAVPPLRRSLLPLMLGLLSALGLALLLAIAWLGAPDQDIIDLVGYLLLSGLISVGVGAAALAWLRNRRGRIWQQITLAFTVGVAIALFNVFLTARLMFISADHDLVLLVLLLAFAAVVSLALGATLAGALAQRVIELRAGARELAAGNLSTRVSATGTDELAELAGEFNRMASRLAEADRERKRLEDSRRELIAAISHDLRTPLASVRAMVEALSDGLVSDPTTQQRYLATMQTQIAHLNTMIDDLFELAQLEAGALQLDLQRMPAGDLVSDVLEGMRAQAAACQVALQGEVLDQRLVLAAPQKIERVLYNLVSNALRHTPPGGSVIIRVTAGQPGAQAQLVFEVADTGEGIAPGDLAHVFERFYRGEKSRSRATGGAGLGLAIARGIVEAHGGQIWADSAPGSGTRLRFTLPAAQ
jgi:signal transduction histidine kinase